MKNEKGVSLIESLMVIVAVAGIVFLMANLPNALGLISKSNQISIAREIATKQIEDKRNISYLNLVNDIVSITPLTDFRMSSLPNSSGTVKVEDCPPTICTNGEHIKQITVTINWKNNNKQQSIDIKTLIGEGGVNQ